MNSLSYEKYLHPLIKSKSIEQNTEEIFCDTQGHPIMVRFAVLNEGLIGHVEKMYLEYNLKSSFTLSSKICVYISLSFVLFN